jgi:hypothetical protein
MFVSFLSNNLWFMYPVKDMAGITMGTFFLEAIQIKHGNQAMEREW